MEYRPSPEESNHAILESLVYLASVARQAGLSEVLSKINDTIDYMTHQQGQYERSHSTATRASA